MRWTDLLSEAVGVSDRLDVLRHFGHERAQELHHLQALHEDKMQAADTADHQVYAEQRDGLNVQ